LASQSNACKWPSLDTSGKAGIRVSSTIWPILASGLPIYRGDEVLANHLTPTELAREAGMERREVITKCMELGVPIFQGRIDKTLFLASLRDQGKGHSQAQVAKA
jgi:hypothetical protein